MIHDIMFSLWFLLPAAIANVVPILSAAIPFLNKLDAPIDGGKSFHGHRILGPHKTWRGIITGVAFSTLIFWVQVICVRHFGWAQSAAGNVDYSRLPVWLLGPLFGIGALGGDAIASFFKRERGVPSGKSWVPFDQLDYIIGGVLVTVTFVILTLRQYVFIFILWFIVHLGASYIGFMVGLKDEPI